MKLKVESGKPVPVRRKPRVREEFLNTLRDLKVGHSFEWEMSSYDRNAISFAGRLLKRTFTTRGAGRPGVRRIWRTT